VGYGKGWNNGVGSEAAQATHTDNDDVNILVVLKIPGVVGPTMHVFTAWARLKSKKLNNCGFFSQRFIVLQVYDEV
jgi:hypothetical protein